MKVAVGLGGWGTGVSVGVELGIVLGVPVGVGEGAAPVFVGVGVNGCVVYVLVDVGKMPCVKVGVGVKPGGSVEVVVSVPIWGVGLGGEHLSAA